MVVVCRREGETRPQPASVTVDDWVETVAPLGVGKADLRNFADALDILGSRAVTVMGVSNEDSS